MEIANPSLLRLTSQALPIGFGCAHLQYSARSRPQSLRLLEEAFDNGITHFDLARLYSDGEAEGIVGDFARNRRDKIILVSKAGILPLKQTLYHRLGRKFRTTVRTNVPRFSGWLKPAIYEPIFDRFSQKDIRSSVETSLRKLRTDYLDALLLHECKCFEINFFQLYETLERLRTEGKILAYGTATDIKETADIVRLLPYLTSIVQIPIKDLNSTAWPFLHDKNRLVIAHSVLTRNLDFIVSRIQAENSIPRGIRSKLGFDLGKATGVAQLLVANAIRQNPEGIVLFSSSKLEHIKLCVEAAKAARAWTGQDDETIDFLYKLAAISSSHLHDGV